MIRKDIQFQCPGGLHARAASALVQCANRYTSRITLTRDQKTVNAKSMMGVLSLGLHEGENVCLYLSGEDEQAACEALCALFDSRFDRV